MLSFLALVWTEMAIENLQPLAYTVSTIAFVIGSCSIFLRLYCRWRLRVFGWDDFMAIFLFVSVCSLSRSLVLT